MADGPYDVVIVGGGHNGLTCGAYLAKAGRRVLVLEARDVVGGGCATKEVAAPGFRHNFHSNFHGIIHMGPVYRDLELERYGARYVWPENQFAHVFPDGRALVCSRNLERTVENVARFSERDAETFREVAHTYREVLEEGMVPAMFSAPAPPSHDLADLEGSAEGLSLIRQFLTTPNHLARELFETPEVQTWIGFWVAQLAGTGDVFGLGANYPIMVAGSLEPYGWAICQGGSNRLAQAMAAFLLDHGGEIRVGAPVARIEVDGDGARSVKLETGETISVDGILVSNLAPRHTFLELVGEENLDDTLARACGRWRYDVMSMFCVYLALDTPVRWKPSADDPEVARRFAERLEPYRGTSAIVVYVVPLLVEGELEPIFDIVVTISADEEVRVGRMVRDRGMPEESVRDRMRAQASDEERERAAAFVIRNDGTPGQMEGRVDELWADLRRRAEAAG